MRTLPRTPVLGKSPSGRCRQGGRNACIVHCGGPSAHRFAARDRYVDATWGLGITAVGAVTVAGLLYWFDAKAPERAVMPAITSDGIGATVSGRF